MRDEIGNELRVGDLVMVMLGTTQLRGRVKVAREGGMVGGVRGKGTETMPAIVEVECVVSVNGPGGVNARIMNVVRLVDPEATMQVPPKPALIMQ